MIIKYVSFLVTLIWSFACIKSQGIFKKAHILITLFVTNISVDFYRRCFYGLKNLALPCFSWYSFKYNFSSFSFCSIKIIY